MRTTNYAKSACASASSCAVSQHFAINLNLLARQDKIAPVYGRDDEIQQVLEILCTASARIGDVIGEPGVGMTAIVEGLARRIEFEPDTVPFRLRDCQVVNLQMTRWLPADACGHVSRSHSERHPRDQGAAESHLFVDEAHTMARRPLGAWCAVGCGQRVQIVLARGEVRMIGATTLSEYKEYIQEDEALARRFRTVQVLEPTIEETRRILYNLRARLERNYSVRLMDEAIETVLELSPRYQRHLHLPDKVIGWLETAAVRAEIDRRWRSRRRRHRCHLAHCPDSQGHGLPRRRRALKDTSSDCRSESLARKGR